MENKNKESRTSLRERMREIVNILKSAPVLMVALLPILAGCDSLQSRDFTSQRIDFTPYQSRVVESDTCVSTGEVQVQPVDNAGNVVTFFLDELGALVPDEKLCDGIMEVNQDLSFKVRPVNN